MLLNKQNNSLTQSFLWKVNDNILWSVYNELALLDSYTNNTYGKQKKVLIE